MSQAAIPIPTPAKIPENTLAVTLPAAMKPLLIIAGAGIGIAAWDIYKGVSDIKGSDTAEKFRKQAEEYDKNTDSLEHFITSLSSYKKENG